VVVVCGGTRLTVLNVHNVSPAPITGVYTQ
jgi:hypothetical protein